ncbi:MAG: hypothetical protein TREMPRED_001869 [Tremellales sp. Tagirdzhanova-0007]|nr:MAG: hypothetical protein TREMPRED_001869 [Tremellales sp. Tagirdzhanova-0007]
MVLKAGVGLGQVVTLVTVLILASSLPSPVSPNAPQATPSSACPHPERFQAWIGSRRSQEDPGGMPERQIELPMSPVRPTTISSSASLPNYHHSPSASSSLTLVSLGSGYKNTDSAFVKSSETSGNTTSTDVEEQRRDREGQMAEAMTEESEPSFYNRDERREATGLPGWTGQGEHGEEPPNGYALWLDRHAPEISKGCGAFSVLLFVLGNLLVFYPLPNRPESCYHASPMLWWGVASVTGVGWFLFAQVFFVVVVVGIGGHAVLVVLRRIHILPNPPRPEARPARPPAPLSADELSKLKVVCFVPADDCRSPNISTTNTPLEVCLDSVDYSRLPFPPIFLDSHQSTCAICQENFSLPQIGRTILLKSDPLRLLDCGHVFHMNCIDQWLLTGSGSCPFCNRPVRPTADDFCEKDRGGGGSSSGHLRSREVTPA